MTIIDLAGWVWLLGLAGLALAAVLALRGARAAGEAARAAPGPFLRRTGIAFAAVVVLGIVLLSLVIRMKTAAAFGIGAASAAAAGLFALWVGARAGSGPGRGAAVGLAAASLGLLGLGIVYYFGITYAGVTQQVRFEEFVDISSGFALGAALAALFLRVGGGICAGGSPGWRAAGSAADLLGSLACAVAAAWAVGATDASLQGYDNRIAAVSFPVLALALGLVASALCLPLARALRRRGAGAGLRAAVLAATAVFLVAAWFVATRLGFDMTDEVGTVYRYDGPYWALLAGALAGVAIGWLPRGLGARGRAADAAVAEPDPAAGAAVGLAATAFPVTALAVAAGVGYALAGLYGVALAAVGIVATLGVTAAAALDVPAVAPVTAPADASAADADAVRTRDAGAAGRAFASAAAGLAALALAAGVGSAPKGLLEWVDVFSGRVLAGLLVGGAAPFVFAALVLMAALRTGADPGRAALRGLIVPGLIAVAVPVLTGALVGLDGLCGLLAGAVVAGVPLSLFLVHAWDGAGERLACAGLAVNVALKLMGAVSLVLVPFFLRFAVNTQFKGPPGEPDGGLMLDALRHAVSALLG
ncbi:MAG TPA: sodium/proton-translocating pyrophosphatase [Longimicrobium sp.]